MEEEARCILRELNKLEEKYGSVFSEEEKKKIVEIKLNKGTRSGQKRRRK